MGDASPEGRKAPALIRADHGPHRLSGLEPVRIKLSEEQRCDGRGARVGSDVFDAGEAASDHLVRSPNLQSRSRARKCPLNDVSSQGDTTPTNAGDRFDSVNESHAVITPSP